MLKPKSGLKEMPENGAMPEYITIESELTYSEFDDLKKAWGFNPLKTPLIYSGSYSEIPVECELMGYKVNDFCSGQELWSVQTTTLVIKVNGNLHCISPGLIAEMQKK